MKTLFTTVAAWAALIALTPEASGQGTVTFTSLASPSKLTEYRSQAAWTLLLDVQHGGRGSLNNGSTTNFFDTTLGGAYTAGILLSETNGIVTVSYVNQNGRFGSTGNMGGTNISSSALLSGIVIGMTDAFTPDDGGATITDLYLNSYYQPFVADSTGGATFGGGLLCSFSDPTDFFNSFAFTLNQPAGSGGEMIYVIGLEATPVPEPGPFVLAGFGGLALFAGLARRKQ
jgi:hypothetical protein